MIQRLFSIKAFRALTIIIVLVTTLALVIPSFTGCAATTPPGTFTELLGLVPAAEASGKNPVCFTLIDYALAYKDAGISFTTMEEFRNVIETIPHEILFNLPAMGSFITGYGYHAIDGTIEKKYVGYDIGDVDAVILFGQPPREGAAVIGRFSAAATNNALNGQDEWPDWAKTSYAREDYNGVTIHSWGDGLQTHMTTRLSPPHINDLGRAMPLAVTDKYLFYHPSLETVKLMVDASRQEGESLADLPEYASVPDQMAGLHIYQAVIAEASVANLCATSLNDSSLHLTEESKAYLIKKMGTPLKKFITFGSGSGKDEKGIFTAIVIYHANSAAARENVSLFEQHIGNSISSGLGKTWSEFFTTTDIKAEGKLLIAKLYGPSSSFFQSWIYDNDSLLYHEE